MPTKLLVISDVHGSMKSLNRIKAVYHKEEPDLAVICGDITHFGPKEMASKFLSRMDLNAIGVIGNCDPPEVKDVYEENDGTYLHLNPTRKNGISFLGLSGSKHDKETLKRFRGISLSNDIDVFVLHQPPYGYLDKASRGKHLGEEALLPMIDEAEPRLVLSGHVHEDRGIIEERNTIYLNPGPASDDNLGIVEIDSKGIDARLV